MIGVGPFDVVGNVGALGVVDGVAHGGHVAAVDDVLDAADVDHVAVLITAPGLEKARMRPN